MSTRLASACALGLFFSACSRASEQPPAPAGPRPDIVLVSIDSLRPDHLSCYGYGRPTSPRIDALAAEGVRCAVALSTTSWTLPAHAALFTGLNDSTHGVVTNGQRLSEEHLTLAEALHERGYRTAGFFGGPYLHPCFGLGQGFDVWESCMSPLTEQGIADGALGGDAAHEDVTGPRTVAAVGKWLATTGDEPLFLFVHLFDVHHDYAPPREYLELFDADYAGTTDFSHVDRNPAISKDMSPRDRQHLLARYDGEIRFTDENLGRLLDLVAARRAGREQLLLVTADHGEEFFEHGGKGHQRSLYEEVVRIPMLWRWPGHLPARTSVHEPVRLVDVMPSLLAAAGPGPRPPMQGRDVLPLLAGKPIGSAPVLLELLVDASDVRGVRYPESKILDWRGEQKATYGFHLVRDRFESRPFGLDQDWVVKGREELERLLDENRDLRRRLDAEPAPLVLTPEVQQRLHQFGYTDGERKPPR